MTVIPNFNRVNWAILNVFIKTQEVIGTPYNVSHLHFRSKGDCHSGSYSPKRWLTVRASTNSTSESRFK